MRRPSPHNKKTNPNEGFRQVKNQCYRPLSSFSCVVMKSFHLQQNLPHCSLSSSIASHSTRYCCCHFVTSGARKKHTAPPSPGIPPLLLLFLLPIPAELCDESSCSLNHQAEALATRKLEYARSQCMNSVSVTPCGGTSSRDALMKQSGLLR